MRTESRKAFRNGFLLTEQEFRRMHDSMTQQIKKVVGQDNFSTAFELKFRNGAIAETSLLDDVFSQENSGTASIHRLRMKLIENKDEYPHVISVEFTNVDAEFDLSLVPSIEYLIIGNDRDWVFITSSQIDDRISKIKRFAPNQLATRKGFFVTAFLMFFISLLISVLTLSSVGKDTRTLRALDVVSEQWKSGEIHDPVEALLAIEKVKADPSIGTAQILHEPTAFIPFAILVFLMLGVIIWWFFFPIYNFYWGDYIKIFDRKQSIGKFILVGIFISIVISVFSNYLTTLIGIGK